MTLSLGIDVGTSGIRTAVIDPDGTVLSMARATHFAQDPDRIDAELWWAVVRTCIVDQTNALRELGYDPKDIRAIAVDGTSGTMVLTDPDLSPVGRALMYNSKGFHAQSKQISKHAPDSHITQGSASALGRAMQLAAEDPERRARHLLHQADFIAAKLTGQGQYSDHNNALKTGFDPETESWPDWIGNLFPAALLPSPLAVGTPIGTLRADLARDLGLSDMAVVHAGTTDSIAAFLAACPLETGNAVTSLGSTLAIKMLSAQRVDDPEIGLYSHRLGGSWLVGGASNTGGAVLSNFFDVSEIERLSLAIDPDQVPALDYYPLNQPGERFPINDPNLQPRLSPRPADDAEFLHGMFEGIAAIEARCYEAIDTRGSGYPLRIFSAGGAAQNTVLTRIRARHLRAPLVEAQQSEAAVGAAQCTRLQSKTP